MTASYSQTLRHLYGLRRFGLRPGLEVIGAVLKELGHPEQRFPSVHVAGSKGKGSVSAFTASILSAAGLKTGLFTSPHLQSFRERIQVDRVPISPGEVVGGVERIQEASRRLLEGGQVDRAPTFFETATALAFDHFARQPVDAAVVEVGIGGRLDATNVLQGSVGVVTTIEREHTDILGDTLEAIAREKAGIFKPGMSGVVAEQKPEPLREIERVAASRGVPLWHLGREIHFADRVLSPKGQRIDLELPSLSIPGLAIPLHGTFQARNAAVAVAAAALLARARGFPLSASAYRNGIARTRWRGRLERIGRRPALYVDVAHTPESCRALAESLAEIDPVTDPERNVLLFGCLSGKRPAEMFEALGPLFRTVVLVPLRSDRCLPVSELALAAEGRFRIVVRASSVEQGLTLARAGTDSDGFTLVAGSDYLVGEVLDVLEGRSADEPDLSDPGWTAPRSLPAPGTLPKRERR